MKSPLEYYKEDWDEPLPDYEAACAFTEAYINYRNNEPKKISNLKSWTIGFLLGLGIGIIIILIAI